MADYIEREAAKAEILSWAVCIKHPEHLLKEDAMCVLDAIPTADVAPVVRCKDCISGHGQLYGGLFRCNVMGCGGLKPDDFCSYGERRDDNG